MGKRGDRAPLRARQTRYRRHARKRYIEIVSPIATSTSSNAARRVAASAEFEGPGVHLFASDGADSEPMKGCALLLEQDDVEDARALFAALSTGGRVTVAFARLFWGWYGNFTDRFGVQWAVLVNAAASPSP
jgi:PhnB protein